MWNIQDCFKQVPLTESQQAHPELEVKYYWNHCAQETTYVRSAGRMFVSTLLVVGYLVLQKYLSVLPRSTSTKSTELSVNARN